MSDPRHPPTGVLPRSSLSPKMPLGAAVPPVTDAMEIAAECRKEGRRIYNRERARRSLVECENVAIACAIEAAEARGERRGFTAGEACAVDNALSILREEGWLGSSERRIRDLLPGRETGR